MAVTLRGVDSAEIPKVKMLLELVVDSETSWQAFGVPQIVIGALKEHPANPHQEYSRIRGEY